MVAQLLSKERFVSIREAQAGLSNVLAEATKNNTYYRVLRNNKPVGVLIPQRIWEDLLEDIEAAASKNFQNQLAKSQQSTERIPLEQVAKELNLD